jgi:alkylhydroperoxidase family enzyme
MRLQILENGHGIGTKALFTMIRMMSRQPVLDVVKLARYRPDFYGKPMSKVTHEAMRGLSSWSVGDRELMAAFIAKTNESEFCTKAHTAVAQRAYGEGQTVPRSFTDAEITALPQPLRATLLMLQKLTRQQGLDAEDMSAVFAAGANRQQIEDALSVCFSFNVITRLADCFGFAIPGPDAFAAGAKYLVSRGYR